MFWGYREVETDLVREVVEGFPVRESFWEVQEKLSTLGENVKSISGTFNSKYKGLVAEENSAILRNQN